MSLDLTDAMVAHLREFRRAERERRIDRPNIPGQTLKALIQRGLFWQTGREGGRLTGRGRVYADEIEKGAKAAREGRGRNEMRTEALRLGWDIGKAERTGRRRDL